MLPPTLARVSKKLELEQQNGQERPFPKEENEEDHNNIMT